jgi:E1-E2 ATPase
LRQQGKAESAMNALQSMLKTSARVRRDGTQVKLDADQVVVGDVVLLTAGDDVCADGRLIEAGRADVRQGDDLGRDRAGGRACPDYPRRVRRTPARRGIVGNRGEEVTMLSRGYEIHMRGAVPAQLLAEMLSAHPTLEVRTVLSGSVRDQAEL